MRAFPSLFGGELPDCVGCSCSVARLLFVVVGIGNESAELWISRFALALDAGFACSFWTGFNLRGSCPRR